MQALLYLLIAVLAAALGACLVLLRKRQANGVDAQQAARAAELEQEKAENVRLERELAIERERTSQLRGVEEARRAVASELEAARGGANDLERQLAVAREAGAGLQTSLGQVEARLKTTETRLEASEAELTKVRVSDGEKAAQLLDRDAALEVKAGQLNALDEDLRQARAREAGQGAELARLRETLEQERTKSAEKIELLTNVQDTLFDRVKVFTNDLMTQHGDVFSKQNKEQIETLLNPLREKMVEFQQGLQTAHTESVKERTELGSQIKQLTQASATMTNETANLTRALKGKAQTQGAWGEMILTTILEKSGLREGQEYRKQTTHTADAGRRLRPDVIVDLPGGDHVVIDAKVSLVAFEAYVNAASDEERALHLKKHVESIRTHIKSLSSKEYQAISDGGLDYVVLFIPIEGAFAVALSEEPSLTLYAAECNVAVATPSTLMMSLRTVHSVWQVERRHANAEAMADRAGKLYGKFVAFLADFAQIGARLTQATDSYQSAMGKLSGGPGNVIKQIEMLKEMGAKTTKAIPAALLGDGGGEGDAEDGEEAA